MGINTDTFWVIVNPIGYHFLKIKNHFGYQKLVPFPKFYKMYLKIIVIIFYFDFVKL